MVRLVPMLLTLMCSSAYALDGPDWCESVEVRSSGFERAALVSLPPGYSDTESTYPVVFMFHGGEGSAKQAASWWQSLRREPAILVFPDGQSEVKELHRWAVVNGDRLQHVQFVRDLLESLKSRYRVDSMRVYASGFSAGGRTTYSLMCYAPELFAGFAIVSQTLNLEDAKACEVDGKPVVLITGDQDPKSFWHGKPGTMSVPQTVDFLRAQAGCSEEQSTKNIDEPGDGTRVRHVTYGDCAKAASVEFLHIEGGAHAWPGRAKDKAGQCQDIDGGRVVLDFFSRSAGL